MCHFSKFKPTPNHGCGWLFSSKSFILHKPVVLAEKGWISCWLMNNSEQPGFQDSVNVYFANVVYMFAILERELCGDQHVFMKVLHISITIRCRGRGDLELKYQSRLSSSRKYERLCKEPRSERRKKLVEYWQARALVEPSSIDKVKFPWRKLMAVNQR